jgi:hypothetical protein
MVQLAVVSTGHSAETIGKLAMIETFDFSRIRGRMNVDYPTPDDQMDRYEREVKRFQALVVLEPGLPHMVSEKIDTLWHYQLLHTREYRDFCQEVFGTFLHHVPILPEEKAQYAEKYVRTRELYAKHFGEPPTDLWGDNAQICWGGCDEIRDQDAPPRDRRRAIQ